MRQPERKYQKNHPEANEHSNLFILLHNYALT